MLIMYTFYGTLKVIFSSDTEKELVTWFSIIYMDNIPIQRLNMAGNLTYVNDPIFFFIRLSKDGHLFLPNQFFIPATCAYSFAIGGAKWVGRLSIRFLVGFFKSA